MSEFIQGVECGDNVKEIVSCDNGRVIKMENETGEGFMTMYEVFPGAILMFNDFHMEYCESKFQANDVEIFCIDHCREGSMKYKLKNGCCYYYQAGDLVVDNRRNHAGQIEYPLKHFHGVTIGFYLPLAEEQLTKEFKDFSVSLYSLQKKFCEKSPYVIKARNEIEHILAELYRVPMKIKKDYFRIKIFELLLYLDALEFDEQQAEKLYFYKSQVEKIKAMRKLMTEDLTRRYTIEELAKEFDISQTAMKRCFKMIYGNSINRYMQEYRINIAATMLIQKKDKSVSEIAGLVGYDSPSKFAAVFKKIMGVSPLDYRSKVCTRKQ